MATVEERLTALEAADVTLTAAAAAADAKAVAAQAKVLAAIAAVKALAIALQPTFCIAEQHNRETYPNGILSIQAAQKAALVAAEAALVALE